MPDCPRLELDWGACEPDEPEPLCILQHDDEGLCDPHNPDDDCGIAWDYGYVAGARKYRQPLPNRHAFVHFDTGMRLVDAHVLRWFLDRCKSAGCRVFYTHDDRHSFTLLTASLADGENLPEAVLGSVVALQKLGRWPR